MRGIGVGRIEEEILAFEVERLLDEIIEGTTPDRIGRYEHLRDWVHKTAKQARARLAPPGDTCLHDNQTFDRSLCWNGWMHTYCDDCDQIIDESDCCPPGDTTDAEEPKA